MVNLLSNRLRSSGSRFAVFRRMAFEASKSTAVLLLAFLLCAHSGSSQQVFNKAYTLAGRQSIVRDLFPLGTDGSFVAFCEHIDSLSGKTAVKMVRGDGTGAVRSIQQILHPNDPDTSIILANFNEACKIHDNLFALVATRFVHGLQSGNSLLTLDSNGNLQHIQEILEPIPGAAAAFSALTSVQYDKKGFLIVSGHNGSDRSTDPSNQILIMKFDTTLTLIWKRLLQPSGLLPRLMGWDLFLGDGSYLLFGGATHNSLSWSSFYYREQSLIVSTDTSGVEQWHYASVVKDMYECEASITCGIPTNDGGYLYLSTGNVYNFYGAGPAIDPWGKYKLIKLDAARNRVWEKELERFNLPYGMRNERMMELEDGSIVLGHSYDTDSLSSGYSLRDLLFSRYRSDGSLMYHRKLTPPKDVGDTSRIFSSWGIVDLCRMPDKGFLLGGAYRNETWGTAGYGIQKAWLIRLDSNGFLSAGDTGSVAVSIPGVSPVQSGVTISPNPGRGLYRLHISKGSSQSVAARLQVSDLSGRLLLEQGISAEETPIDLSGYPGGMYFYRLVMEGEQAVSGKLMKL